MSDGELPVAWRRVPSRPLCSLPLLSSSHVGSNSPDCSHPFPSLDSLAVAIRLPSAPPPPLAFGRARDTGSPSPRILPATTCLCRPHAGFLPPLALRPRRHHRPLLPFTRSAPASSPSYALSSSPNSVAPLLPFAHTARFVPFARAAPIATLLSFGRARARAHNTGSPSPDSSPPPSACAPFSSPRFPLTDPVLLLLRRAHMHPTKLRLSSIITQSSFYFMAFSVVPSFPARCCCHPSTKFLSIISSTGDGSLLFILTKERCTIIYITEHGHTESCRGDRSLLFILTKGGCRIIYITKHGHIESCRDPSPTGDYPEWDEGYTGAEEASGDEGAYYEDQGEVDNLFGEWEE